MELPGIRLIQLGGAKGSKLAPEGPEYVHRKREGLKAGAAISVLYEFVGGRVYNHEDAHRKAFQAFYKDARTTVQMDTFDNIRNFLKSPSKETFAKLLSFYDANKDGALGYTQLNTNKGLSDLGKSLSTEQRDAVINAVGSLSTVLPALIGFAAGAQIRRRHPKLGFALMALGGSRALVDSFYPLSAALPGKKWDGHDWANFSKNTGVPPVIPGLAIALALPAIAISLHLREERALGKEKDRIALAKLIDSGEISDVRLHARMAEYPKGRNIKEIEDKITIVELSNKTALDAGFPIEERAQKELRGLYGRLQKEYDGFFDFLIEEHRGRVDEIRKELFKPTPFHPVETLKTMASETMESYEKDKIGTLLTGAGVSSTVAVTVASGAAAAEMLSRSSAPILAGPGGNVISRAIPILGVLGAFGTVYEASKVLRNETAPGSEKLAAASYAAFAALGAASLAAPGIGFPLALASIGGTVGTGLLHWAHKRLAPSFCHDPEDRQRQKVYPA